MMEIKIIKIEQKKQKESTLLPIEVLLKDPAYEPWTFGEKSTGPMSYYPGMEEAISEAVENLIKKYTSKKK